ncbi:Alpha/Beta hydrolase protein [Tirmania nivea]|nr:Alpha/Beta hydrolase protein [Tirmania nivea]
MPLPIPSILSHPSFPTVISLPPPTRKGKAPVAKIRGGPFEIAWEVYGEGGCGLLYSYLTFGAYSGVDRGHTYSSLVFDNRGITYESTGVGNSDKPLVRYTTSEMARDLLEVLEHVGWVGEERRIHLVGTSMGGGLLVNAALLAPHLLASLTLQSTTAKLISPLPWYTTLANRLIMFLPKPLPLRIQHTQSALFTPTFLSSSPSSPTTNPPFPTNADLFTAEELWRRTRMPITPWANYLLQGLAVSGHYVSPSRLKSLGEVLEGRVKIRVVTGDEDKLVEWTHSKEIVEGLGEGRGELVVERSCGHMVHWERELGYNVAMEEYFGMGERAWGRGVEERAKGEIVN